MGRNDFCGITKEMVLDKTSNLNMDRKSYSFTYSNYGYAVLGLVFEAVYDTDYTTLVNYFLQNGLGLTNTKISDKMATLVIIGIGRKMTLICRQVLLHQIYPTCFPTHKCSLKTIRILSNVIKALKR